MDAREGRRRQAPDRNLALELVRVTEAAAMAAARWMGRGDKEGADGAAVDAMRIVLGSVPMDGVVVIGEGEKDEAPMLYNGEEIGDGTPPHTDVAVDPIDGTTPTAFGRGGAAGRSPISYTSLARRKLSSRRDGPGGDTRRPPGGGERPPLATLGRASGP